MKNIFTRNYYIELLCVQFILLLLVGLKHFFCKLSLFFIYKVYYKVIWFIVFLETISFSSNYLYVLFHF